MFNFECSFEWQRPVKAPFLFREGFLEIEPGKISKKSTRVLSTDGADYPLEFYNPLDEAMDLYRLFAQLDTDEESIAEFANKYGLLGLGPDLQHQTKLEGVRLLVWTEPQQTWAKEIKHLWRTLDLWESIRPRGDSQTLDSKLVWFKDKEKVLAQQLCKLPEGIELMSPREVYCSYGASNRYPDIKYKDNLSLAHLAVQSDIDQQLRKHTSARFLAKDSGSFMTSLGVQPKNLLGCIWLQLALEVAGHTVYDPCSQCGKPMVEPIKRGKIRKTCSDACRKRLSRSKH